MQKNSRLYSLKSLIIFIAAISLYRFYTLTHVNIDLYADEAYYWGWAQHFDFGYYSKPPMVAWLIMLSTSLCGDSFVCIKIGSLFVYFFTTMNIYYLAKELFDDEEIAFFSAITFVTLPAVWLSSLIISTDVPFLFFWSLGMLFFVKALKSDRWSHWLVVAVAGGGGLLSKYTMIIFVVSAFAYLIFSPKYRGHLKNPKLYATMVLAALIYMPNLYWNYTHEFVSFKHTEDNAHLEGDLFHPLMMLEFLGAQFGVFGPILFGWLLAILPRVGTLRRDDRLFMLWWFIVPFFLLILTISLLSRAHANWSAPMYVASTVLVVAWLVMQKRFRWLYAAIVVNIALGVGLYQYHSIADALGVELTRKSDPYKRVLGWRELGAEVGAVLKEYPGAKLLSDDRKTMAELIYYIEPHPFDAVKWNPRHTLLDHYELTTDLERHKGEDFIFVTGRSKIPDVERSFASAKLVKRIEIPLYKDYKMVYYVYYLKHFKGYR